MVKQMSCGIHGASPFLMWSQWKKHRAGQTYIRLSLPICCCWVRGRQSMRYMPYFLLSQSLPHSLKAVLMSSCCPCPFSVMFLTHSFFFSNSYFLFLLLSFMKQFPILLPFLTLGIQFYMHVHICTHTLCLYKENLNKIKHQSNKTKTYSSITGPKKFQQHRNIC